MQYPAGFAFATVDELSDIVDGLAVGIEELRYRATLEDDYEQDDIREMLDKADRIDRLFIRFVIALDGAAKAEATVRAADALNES